MEIIWEYGLVGGCCAQLTVLVDFLSQDCMILMHGTGWASPARQMNQIISRSSTADGSEIWIEGCLVFLITLPYTLELVMVLDAN